MKHLDEDILLAYALETIEDSDEQHAISEHLAECPECRAQLQCLKADVDLIGGVRGEIKHLPQPLPRRSNLAVTLLKVAALLLCGIVVGYGAARLQVEEQVCVEPAYLAVSPPSGSQAGAAASDATDVSAGYDNLSR